MDEIIDYVMETPGNTNPNVLRGMLNNSGGSGSGVLIVNGTIDAETQMDTLDKTWQEIHDAGYAIIREVLRGNVMFAYIERVIAAETAGESVQYMVETFSYDGAELYSLTYIADSPNGYPSASMG